MNYHWDWSVLVQQPYLDGLVAGLGWTCALAIVAWAIAFIIGLAVGTLRTVPPGILRRCATAYVDVFRNIPLLVQVFLWFFVLPEVLPQAWGHWLKRDLVMPEFWAAAVGLGLFSAARIAEQVRAGIEAVPCLQIEAALATGLRLPAIYRYVLLPRALRTIVPTLTSETTNVVKNTSIAVTLGLLELTGEARQIESYTFQGFEAFTACTVLYLALCSAIVGAGRVIEAHARIPGMIGKG